jgi:hypothetical protein
MPTCFVMQPFDGSTFDQRYEEIFSPAIRAAGLDPYRVDQDPKVGIPIEEIETGIRSARVCLAEISTDNPNVWFELGYAIACGKEVVLICSDARQSKFPFDVQHRSVIKYKTSSPSDFEKLQRSISEKIQAYIEKSEALAGASEVATLASAQSGLDQHEIVALAAVTQNINHENDHVSTWQIKRDMEASGFTPVAATFALKVLTQRGYLTSSQYTDDREQYFGYELTEKGWAWALGNQDKFALRNSPRIPKKRPSTGFDDMDDKIPF